MKLMQRLGGVATSKYNDEYIEMITKNPGSCDDVWIATKYGYPKNETHREFADFWKVEAEKFRKNGIGVSMQISNTLGHGKYMMASDCSGLVFEGSPARKLVGHDGSVADYCFCWRDEFFRDYLCEHLSYYAEIKPDRIWFDDDFRPSNHAPVEYGCYCDDCIKTFNEKHGASFTRETLVEEFLHGDKAWREKYIAFIREGMAGLMRAMCETIHAVSPETKFGYQHGAYGAYAGYGYDHIYDVMKEVSGEAPATRPGGGSYNDHNPNDFLHKSLYINWQNSMMPDYVKMKAPEIENLPFVAFGKSPAGTAFETSFYMANGNTDMSYSMLMTRKEPLEYHMKEFRLFSQHRKYWEEMSKYNYDSYQAGLRYYYSKYIWKKDLLPEEGMEKINEQPYLEILDMLRTAIPMVYDQKDNDIIILHPESAKLLQPEDVEFLKGKNIVTDGESIHILKEKGYDFGIDTREITPDEALIINEKFVEHPTHPGVDAFKVSFFSGGRAAAYAMDPVNTDCEIVAHYNATKPLEPYFENTDLPYGVSEMVITTDKGGKWAILGYCPWKNIIPSNIRDHILDLADYVSDNGVCARLITPVQAVLNPRKNNDGKVCCVSITNCTIGKSGEMELLIREPLGEKFYFMSQYNGECELSYEKLGEDYIIKVPSIDAWSVGTVFVK